MKLLKEKDPSLKESIVETVGLVCASLFIAALTALAVAGVLKLITLMF